MTAGFVSCLSVSLFSVRMALMDKNVVTIAVVLLTLFGLTFFAHSVYVSRVSLPAALTGEAKERHSTAPENEKTISVFGSRKECERATGGSCIMQICDNIPPGQPHEDICGQGFKEIWQQHH